MKHLLTMRGEQKVKPKIKSNIQSLFASSPSKNDRFIICKLNGYFFYLSVSMWSRYTGICSGTILGRLCVGRTNAQSLGFEKIIRRNKKS